MHPAPQVGEDPLRQQLNRRGAHPVPFLVVGVPVVAGCGDDVHAGRFGHRPHLGRVPAEADRRHLDNRLQSAVRRAADLLDRLVDVVELLSVQSGAAEKEVVVRIGHAKLQRRDRAEHRNDLSHER